MRGRQLGGRGGGRKWWSEVRLEMVRVSTALRRVGESGDVIAGLWECV